MIKVKSHFDETITFVYELYFAACPHLSHYVRQLVVKSKNRPFIVAILNGNPPKPSLFIGALLSLHNDAEKVPRKHTKRALSCSLPQSRKLNNACKLLPLLSASLKVMSLPSKLKANELALGLAFNQASDQQQIAHQYLASFPRLNYLELCSSNELCTATN